MLGSMRSRSLLVLFCAAFLCCTSLVAQAQTSTSSLLPPTIPSSLSEPLWQTLYPLIMGLPTQFQSFRDNLLSQVSSLQGTMLSLQQDNGYLTESQTILEGLVVTSQKQLTRSQTDLALSLTYTTQIQTDLQKAQVDAHALEAQISVLRIGCWTFGVGLGAVAVYEVGHARKFW